MRKSSELVTAKGKGTDSKFQGRKKKKKEALVSGVRKSHRICCAGKEEKDRDF